MCATVFSFDPPLSGPDALTVGQYTKSLGYSMGIISLDTACVIHAQEHILKYGVSSLVNMFNINEQVLSPAMPKSSLADLVRHMLTMCNPASKMIIIDPYFFPDRHSPDYIAFLKSILSTTLHNINTLEIATGKVNSVLKTDFEAMAFSVNSNISISYKCTNYFHDRFVIVDDSKGIYIGTSLNGIGRRFALADYLKDSDVKEILSEYSTIS